MANRERYAIALILLIASCASCAHAAGSRRAQPFCAKGHLVKPGEYMGSVGVNDRNGNLVRVLPLFATDTLCLREAPTGPTVPTSPSAAPEHDGGES